MPVRYLVAMLASVGLLALGMRALPAGEAKKTPTAAAAQFFETKVRPILVESCFSCHGEKKQRGSLRVDSLGALLEGGETSPAIVVGHPEKSLLIKAIHYDDNELKMPPSKKLAREQIDVLEQWIKMGAPWPGSEKAPATTRKGEFQVTDKDRAHWSFQPVKKPLVPKGRKQEWVRNPIDAFILTGLEAKGMLPNGPASKLELLRRVTYDLTGLPPTPEEVDAYLKDNAPNAYENLVDRLLASPRYGEKWARSWLDLVHYAETSSYERDNPKPHVWRYRDYVIRSFNDDKPYDRFLKEQLAGDEMFPGDADALIATGYYRLGIWDDEPSDPKQARYDGLDDIVGTTSQTMLGLTVDCARCHNHKLDPIAHKDYYRLLAFFHNINHYRNGGPTDERPIGTGGQQAAFEKASNEIEEKRATIQGAITAIETEFRKKHKQSQSLVGTDLDELTYRFYRNAWTMLPDFTQFKHEDEGKLPKKLFDISPRTRDEAIGFVFDGFLIVPEAGRYTFYLDSDDGSRLTVDGKTVITYDGIHGVGSPRKQAVDLLKGRLPIKLEYFQNVFGFGLSVVWSGPGFEKRTLSVPEGSQKTLDLAKLFVSEGANVLGAEKVAEYQKLKKQLVALQKPSQHPRGEMALCVTENGTRVPDTFVMVRGNPHVPGDKVEPGFPSVFGLPEPKIPAPAPGAKSSGRRSVLADWIASKDNMLTSRVMVNRIWQQHFGRGIVRSPSDFGMQGIRPTHPELLDWLASEFVESGWRMKSLHKLILMSNTYQMSSKSHADHLAKDPINDLFWRFDMRRLSAEEIRDSILAASGNLNVKMYGPGVYPEIAKDVLAGQSVPGRGWGKSSPEEQARRSIYVHVKRSLVLPILEAFDVAETDKGVSARFATTQPTQALGMLNGEFLHKQASIFAQRLKREAGDDVNAQVRRALSLVTSRAPSDLEVRRGIELIQALREQENASAEAALQSFCLVALNLNEFMYLD